MLSVYLSAQVCETGFPDFQQTVKGLSVAGLDVHIRERSGSVVECLTRDRRAPGFSLTGVTALWSVSKTHLS